MQTQSKLDIVDDKYQRTIIYGIVCLITKEKYVGSTYQSLEERIAEHIRHRNCTVWQILERGNYKAYVIQHYPCNTKRERLTREGAWQRAYKASFPDHFVNKQIEGFFANEKPEAKQAYNKQQYDKNKEKVKRKRQDRKEEIKAYNKQPWACEWCNTTMNKSSKYIHKKRCKSKPSE
jgi:Uri superfamily endonuclease